MERGARRATLKVGVMGGKRERDPGWRRRARESIGGGYGSVGSRDAAGGPWLVRRRRVDWIGLVTEGPRQIRQRASMARLANRRLTGGGPRGRVAASCC